MTGLKHSAKWFQYIAIGCIAFACLSFIGLAVSISSSKLFDKYFSYLLVLNFIIAIVMMLVVGRMCFKLFRNYYKNTFGSKLTAKLAVTNACIAVVPTVVLFLISSTFLSRSDDWFGFHVETALNAGVNITQDILKKQQKNTQDLARQIAVSLSSTPPSMMMSDLLKILEKHHGTEALVLTDKGHAVAAAGSKINVLLPELPSGEQLKVARTTGIYSVVDGDTLFEDPDSDQTYLNGLRIRVIVPIPSIKSIKKSNYSSSSLLPSDDSLTPLYLQIISPIEESIATNAIQLVNGYREYQQTIYTRESMETLYWLTLSLTLLMSIFASIAVAVSFARKTTGPVLQLAIGTKQVADGQLTRITEFTGNDEINTLTRSFNTMVTEVSNARRSLDYQRRQAEQSQAFLESVLSNISSGVLVFDHWYTVVTSNLAAQRIMGSASTKIGTSLKDSEPELIEEMNKLDDLLSESTDIVTLEFELRHDDRNVPLYIRKSPITLGSQMGAILVFDDLTPIIKAQKATAWGEVARRLAHEIKNPLTPILLSAERLEWKLESKLNDQDQVLLHKTIRTIVSQVDALKQMVNDFREFAKLPPANLQNTNLKSLLEEIVVFYQSAGINLDLKITDPIPNISADPAQIRQVLNNLISNSIEASGGSETAHVKISVFPEDEIVHSKNLRTVKLSIEDNGAGFNEQILQSAFEPYITTKPTGTGLGLPMVKKILDEHRAEICLSNKFSDNNQITGALVEITFKGVF